MIVHKKGIDNSIYYAIIDCIAYLTISALCEDIAWVQMSDQAGYGQSYCFHTKGCTLSSQPNKADESSITMNEHIIHRYYCATCQFHKYACSKCGRCSKQKREFNRLACSSISKRCKHTTLHHGEQNQFSTNKYLPEIHKNDNYGVQIHDQFASDGDISFEYNHDTCDSHDETNNETESDNVTLRIQTTDWGNKSLKRILCR